MLAHRLEFLRKQFVNLYELYGITEDEASGKTDFEGMNFVDPTEVKKGNQPVLMQVKGRRRIRVEMVACSYTSLDPSTVFVLDVGTHIYQWNGACSPRVAKGKGLDLASKIRQKERGGVAEYIVLGTPAKQLVDAICVLLTAVSCLFRSRQAKREPSWLLERCWRLAVESPTCDR